MLYLSEVTGIKETRKHADRNRTHLTFTQKLSKRKTGMDQYISRTITSNTRQYKKEHKICPYKTEKTFSIPFKKGKNRHKSACCRKGGREYPMCAGRGRQMMGITRKWRRKRRMKPGWITRRGYLSDSDG